MGKKLILNVAYTIGLFVAAVIAYWGYNNHQYVYVAGGAVIAAMFVFLKIKLLKELKQIKRP